MSNLTRLRLLLLLSGCLLSYGCGSAPDSATAEHGAPAKEIPAAHDTSRVAAPLKNAPATLLGSLRAMTDQLAALPVTRYPDRDAAHQLAEYCRGALDLADLERTHGRDSTLRQFAASFAQEQQPQLLAAQRLAAQLDQAAKTAPAPLPRPAYGQRLRTAREQLVATVQATLGEVGREAHAPNLAMMQGYHDEGTGDADADFAALLVLHQQTVSLVAGTIQELGLDPQLQALAARLLQISQRTLPQLRAWQAHRASPGKVPAG